MHIQDVLTQLSIEYRDKNHVHCRPGWVQIDCPFCSPGWRHFRLGINLRGRYTHCWCCGYHTLLSVLKEITDERTLALRELLGDLEAVYDKPEKPRGRLTLPTQVGPLLPAHRDYIRGRGFDPDHLIQVWGLRGTGFDSNLPWRIIIPVVYRGEVVSWAARRIVDDLPDRYFAAPLSQEKIPKSELLYGEDLCRHTIIVVEGFFDVFRIGPGAVATMTTSYSRAQLLRMVKYPRRVICFDSEEIAQQRASKLLADLAPFGGENYRVTTNAKDCAAASDDEVAEIRDLFLRHE